MAVLDELSVNVGADVADFTAGASRVEEGLDNIQREAIIAASTADVFGESVSDVASEAVTTAGAMQLLANRTDNAGDQLTEAAVKGSATSGAFSSLRVSSSGASASIHGLSVTLVATLLPALTIVTGAIVPIVSALGGLVAIGAAIGGVGLVAAMGAIATNTETLKQEAMALLDTIKGEFSPLFNAATDVLITFIDEIQALVPSLVPAQDVIDTLASQFEALGLTVIEALPAFVELATTIATQFLPAATDLVEGVLSAAPGFIQMLVSDFETLAPTLMDAVDATVTLLGTLREFGFNVLPTVANVVGGIVGFIDRALTVFNNLSGEVRTLGAQFGLALPVIAALFSFLGGPATALIGGVVAAVLGLKTAFDNNIAGIRDVLTSWWADLRRILPAAKEAFNAFVSGADIPSITDALGELENVVANQLQVALDALQPVVSDVIDLFKDNKEEFETFGSFIGDIVEGFIELAIIAAGAIGPLFKQVIVPAFRGAIDVIDVLITKTAELIEVLQAASEGDFEAAIDAGQDLVGVEGDLVADPGQQNPYANNTTQAGGGTTVINRFEGDSGMFEDFIRQKSEEVVSGREAAATRGTGGSMRP